MQWERVGSDITDNIEFTLRPTLTARHWILVEVDNDNSDVGFLCYVGKKFMSSCASMESAKRYLEEQYELQVDDLVADSERLQSAIDRIETSGSGSNDHYQKLVEKLSEVELKLMEMEVEN